MSLAKLCSFIYVLSIGVSTSFFIPDRSPSLSAVFYSSRLSFIEYKASFIPKSDCKYDHLILTIETSTIHPCLSQPSHKSFSLALSRWVHLSLTLVCPSLLRSFLVHPLFHLHQLKFAVRDNIPDEPMPPSYYFRD